MQQTTVLTFTFSRSQPFFRSVLLCVVLARHREELDHQWDDHADVGSDDHHGWHRALRWPKSHRRRATRCHCGTFRCRHDCEWFCHVFCFCFFFKLTFLRFDPLRPTALRGSRDKNLHFNSFFCDTLQMVAKPGSLKFTTHFLQTIPRVKLASASTTCRTKKQKNKRQRRRTSTKEEEEEHED